MDARIVDGRKIARVTDDGKLKVLIHGKSGTTEVPIKVDDDGNVQISMDAVTVDLGQVTLHQGNPGVKAWPTNDANAKTALDAIGTELELLKAELADVKTMLTDGTAKGEVTLSGIIAEKASAQHSESATTVKTYTRAAGAARIEVYVESGRVRIRTDGQPCTAVTGEPLGEGFGAAWAAPSISVLFVSDAVITVVSM